MTTTSTRPIYYSTDTQRHLVDNLSEHQWDKCTTFTLRPQRNKWRVEEHSSGEVMVLLYEFINRLENRLEQPFRYWFGLCQDYHANPAYTKWADAHPSVIHVHGQFSLPSGLTNKEIARCRGGFGHTTIKDYDGRRNWFEYVLGQTRKGEIITNIKELQV